MNYLSVFTSCSSSELQVFSKRVASYGFDENVLVFYWLSKCSQGAGYELEDSLLLAYTSYIRVEGLSGTETRLVRILRSLISVLNRNKIQRALETDAQLQMEAVTHDLLTAAMPRLCQRHRHLSLVDLSLVLT
ncbi:unnamed protein product, partial [Polarella glacialis]